MFLKKHKFLKFETKDKVNFSINIGLIAKNKPAFLSAGQNLVLWLRVKWLKFKRPVTNRDFKSTKNLNNLVTSHRLQSHVEINKIKQITF